MTESEQRFVEQAISRKDLFLKMSLLGIAVAGALSCYYVYLWVMVRLPSEQMGSKAFTGAVVVVLVLLNARQNLRQYRYARVLEGLLGRPGAGVSAVESAPEGSGG